MLIIIVIYFLSIGPGASSLSFDSGAIFASSVNTSVSRAPKVRLYNTGLWSTRRESDPGELILLYVQVMEDDSSVILGSESTPLPQSSNHVPPVGHNLGSNTPERFETVRFGSELKDVSAGEGPILACPGDQQQSLPPSLETHPLGLGTVSSSTGVIDASTTHLSHHGQPYATHPELPSTNGITPTQVHQESVHSATHVAPTKRFTSVNVNRKFLEKTHSSSTVPVPSQINKPSALGPTRMFFKFCF